MPAGFTLFEHRRSKEVVLLRHARDGVKGAQFTCGPLIPVDPRRLHGVLLAELERYDRNWTADVSFLDKLNIIERKRFLRMQREVRITQRLGAVEFTAIQARGSSGMGAVTRILPLEELTDDGINATLVELFREDL